MANISPTMKNDNIKSGAENGRVRETADDSYLSGENLTDKFAHAGAQLRDMVDASKEKGREYYDQVEDHIRERPFQSAAIAFGVGLVAALLLNRR